MVLVLFLLVGMTSVFAQKHVSVSGRITDDAAITYILLTKTGRPVTATFSQAIAKHDDVLACNGRLIHKL